LTIGENQLINIIATENFQRRIDSSRRKLFVLKKDDVATQRNVCEKNCDIEREKFCQAVKHDISILLRVLLIIKVPSVLIIILF